MHRPVPSRLAFSISDLLHARAIAGTALLVATLNVSADCITTGASTVCDATPPTPWTSTLGTGSAATASGSVRLLTGAVVDVGNADAVVMGDGDDLVDLSGAIIGNVAQGVVRWWQRLGLWQGATAFASAATIALALLLATPPAAQPPIVVVMAASIIPARRAARLEPGDVIRGNSQ